MKDRDILKKMDNYEINCLTKGDNYRKYGIYMAFSAPFLVLLGFLFSSAEEIAVMLIGIGGFLFGLGCTLIISSDHLIARGRTMLFQRFILEDVTEIKNILNNNSKDIPKKNVNKKINNIVESIELVEHSELDIDILNFSKKLYMLLDNEDARFIDELIKMYNISEKEAEKYLNAIKE